VVGSVGRQLLPDRRAGRCGTPPSLSGSAPLLDLEGCRSAPLPHHGDTWAGRRRRAPPSPSGSAALLDPDGCRSAPLPHYGGHLILADPSRGLGTSSSAGSGIG
jgi:hypothetical protein